MEKEFVPHRQSIDIRDLGFDEKCFGWYAHNGVYTGYSIKNSTMDELNMIKNSCSAPTYSQAFRWFRENHNLRCQINYIGGLINKTTWWDISVIGHYNTDPKQWEMKYQPYEEAELACLKKLIEIVNEQR